MRNHLSIILIALLAFLTSGGQAHARAFKEQVPPVEQIKAKIAKLGVGEKARAQIKLCRGEKIKGYVSSASEATFEFTERDSKQTRTVAYADVVEVKKSGGLSTGVKIAIGVGIGVAVLAVVVIHAKNHLFDNFHPF